METKVVNMKFDFYDIKIDRSTKWGNPFTHIKDRYTKAKHIVATREEAVESYKEWILNGEGKHLLNDLHELKGKTLGCHCKPSSCHGDILKELADTLTE